MGTYKLLLEESIGYDFTVIALHGSLEPYYVAYLLNKYLDIQLARTPKDLIIEQEVGIQRAYTCFEYKDMFRYIDYYVFENKIKTTSTKQLDEGLFESEDTTQTQFFIPEMQQVDYFIKVIEDGYAFAKAKTLKTLNQIPQIVTAYEVDVEKLKNKQNLIFE